MIQVKSNIQHFDTNGQNIVSTQMWKGDREKHFCILKISSNATGMLGMKCMATA